MDVPKKTTKIRKELPQSILDLFETDDGCLDFINFRMESSPHAKDEEKECMVAYSISSGATTIELEKELTLEQLRSLCRKAGCNYVNSKNKFACRKALHIMAAFKRKMKREGTVMLTADERMTNNIARMCNIIFSSDFLDSFLTLNDAKKRVDHETGNMPKQFWIDVEEAYNCPDEDDDTFSLMVIGSDDLHSEELKNLNLKEYDTMSADLIKKKVYAMIKVRKEVQTNMVVSGEHDNDPYNFMDVGIKKMASGQSLTKLGCYYFFMRCNNHPEIDDKFMTDVEDEIKGNTSDVGVIPDSSYSAQKKRAYSAIADLQDVAKTIAEQMKETNRLASLTADKIDETNRIASENAKKKATLKEQANLISIATSLGDTELLRSLLKARNEPIDKDDSNEEE